jgi:hypothetical protein
VSAAELAQLARRHNVRIDTRLAETFLRDWERTGIAEERLGRWRLTKRGRAMFGGFVGSLYLDDDREGTA